MSQVTVEAETGKVYENPVIWTGASNSESTESRAPKSGLSGTGTPNSGSIYENAAGIGQSAAQNAAAYENHQHKNKRTHQQQAYEDVDTRERLEADTHLYTGLTHQ